MNNMPMDQSQLLRTGFNQVSFVAYDTALYLDTHPYDEKPFPSITHYRTLRLKAVKMYEEKYGPLTLDGADTDGHWSWGKHEKSMGRGKLLKCGSMKKTGISGQHQTDRSKTAQYIKSQYGGPDGEINASLR